MRARKQYLTDVAKKYERADESRAEPLLHEGQKNGNRAGRSSAKWLAAERWGWWKWMTN
jgi:hypothetical protein